MICPSVTTFSSMLTSSPLLRNCFPRSFIKTDFVSERDVLKLLFKGHFESVKMHHCRIAPGYLCSVLARPSKI